MFQRIIHWNNQNNNKIKTIARRGLSFWAHVAARFLDRLIKYLRRRGRGNSLPIEAAAVGNWAVFVFCFPYITQRSPKRACLYLVHISVQNDTWDILLCFLAKLFQFSFNKEKHRCTLRGAIGGPQRKTTKKSGRLKVARVWFFFNHVRESSARLTAMLHRNKDRDEDILCKRISRMSSLGGCSVWGRVVPIQR